MGVRPAGTDMMSALAAITMSHIEYQSASRFTSVGWVEQPHLHSDQAESFYKVEWAMGSHTFELEEIWLGFHASISTPLNSGQSFVEF